MTARARTAGAPEPGYARMYATVPADVVDAFQAAKDNITRRGMGYNVHDSDWWQDTTTDGSRIFVAVWGRPKGWQPKPPKKAVAS